MNHVYILDMKNMVSGLYCMTNIANYHLVHSTCYSVTLTNHNIKVFPLPYLSACLPPPCKAVTIDKY